MRCSNLFYSFIDAVNKFSFIIANTPEEEFKLAELKIKQLLEEKMKAPTMGKYSAFKLAVVNPDIKKPEPKKDEVQDIPDVNIFLKPKPTPKEF